MRIADDGILTYANVSSEPVISALGARAVGEPIPAGVASKTA